LNNGCQQWTESKRSRRERKMKKRTRAKKRRKESHL
jgi:hypothetical protein